MTRPDHDSTFRPLFRRAAFGAVALAAAMLLSACSSLKGGEIDKTAGWSAQRLYQDARDDIDNSNWKDARARLESIEARYPFGVYAQQALIDLAYVDWKDEESDQALAAIARFQQQYPNHPGSDYMLYLKGLALAAIPFVLMAAMAVFLQAVSGNKFIGYLLMIVYLVARATMGMLDLDHLLYRYGAATPEATDPVAPLATVTGGRR